ncbi:NAD(P)-dependent oxidoreductase [Rhodobaculum claviforme]|uniref:NAD(P)-binding domain-containing protein n=1 Tax=Rhodobaculum claviforme TaxID=1549854 RepID=A0A934TLD2_9RHOB|nr:NAD(P)-binding oxidoreductase [Rhodobaculum claviforme]MBK5927743.1 hypothetical protein [Rhodobaculum claviforme]
MQITILGATGGTGRAVTRQALAAGHSVTALVRDPARIAPAEGLSVVTGDAMRAQDVARAMAGGAGDQGAQAVVVALGDRPGALDWLPGRRAASCSGVCAAGTRHVLAALPEGARVVIVSAYGVGDTRAAAPWYMRLYLDLFLGPLMADKAEQEAALKASPADFVIVQPVGLTDGAATGNALISPDGRIRSQTVARADVAALVVASLADGRHSRATLSISG